MGLPARPRSLCMGLCRGARRRPMGSPSGRLPRRWPPVGSPRPGGFRFSSLPPLALRLSPAKCVRWATAAGRQTAPRAELAAALYVAEGSFGTLPAFTDFEHVYSGVAA